VAKHVVGVFFIEKTESSVICGDRKSTEDNSRTSVHRIRRNEEEGGGKAKGSVRKSSTKRKRFIDPDYQKGA